MPKATSTANGASAADRKLKSAERKAGKLVEAAREEASRVRAEAKADAARIRAEAEEHARRLILDARASADGVRAEGMEVVSDLRQMDDALRGVADRLLEDIQAIHARMVGELEEVQPAPSSPTAEATRDSSAADDLDVPDFVAHR